MSVVKESIGFAALNFIILCFFNISFFTEPFFPLPHTLSAESFLFRHPVPGCKLTAADEAHLREIADVLFYAPVSVKIAAEGTAMTELSKLTTGLTTAEAQARLKRFGKNELTPPKKQNPFLKFLHTLCQPMFLLLLCAAVIYFLLGQARDGAVMLVFVCGMIGIDAVQSWKTDKTLNALKKLSAPQVTVLRDGHETAVPSWELVPGDVVKLTEGIRIPADCHILSCSDLCIEESTLTGEAQGVWKSAAHTESEQLGRWRRDWCYAGTQVLEGSAVVLVEQTGLNTEYGKIGVSVAAAPQERSPLQKQTDRLVKVCTVIAVVLFAAVSFFTWLELAGTETAGRLVQSILSGVTLAMAMIPEEFPVVLAVFLSIGAWRLAKQQALVRRLPAVETLGEISVLCVDKTGTITQNQMAVQETWCFAANPASLTEALGLACEPEPYDPMEKAILDYCSQQGQPAQTLFSGTLVREYAFTHEDKRMGHIWQKGSRTLLAAKGCPESIWSLCGMDNTAQKAAENAAKKLAASGLRVLAVAVQELTAVTPLPETLSECSPAFLGLVGLADPPRAGVTQDIRRCTAAGIRVVMITGDSAETAGSIARQTGMPGAEAVVTGGEIDCMDDYTLRQCVQHTNIFARVVPEHKMRIVKALRACGAVTAMTGDGVNDAPALKYADIGIAMGKRGSEVAREASDLVLLDDNFSTIVRTVRDGRRIYDNLCKAVGYLFAIHIPFALSALLVPLLHIAPENGFLLPVHIVVLELLIDPTCSIVLERQPAETNLMKQKPRSSRQTLITPRLMLHSFLQGGLLAAAAFGSYLFWMQQTGNSALARTIGLVVLMLGNLFLVQTGSSRTESILHTAKALRRDKVMWAIHLGTLAGIGVLLYTPLSRFFGLVPLSALQLLAAFLLAAAAVLWSEPVKWLKKRFFHSKRN